MTKNATLALRLGLAFVFAYTALAIYLRPLDWIGFVPGWIDPILDRQTFLHIHGLFDLILAIWLLSGVKIFYSSVLSALNLGSIIIFNLGAMDIVFRDIGLLTGAVALALLTYNENLRR